jgi:hypothetical protein
MKKMKELKETINRIISDCEREISKYSVSKATYGDTEYDSASVNKGFVEMGELMLIHIEKLEQKLEQRNLQKYEYEYEDVSAFIPHKNFINSVARDGWELMSYSNPFKNPKCEDYWSCRLVFRRPV